MIQQQLVVCFVFSVTIDCPNVTGNHNALNLWSLMVMRSSLEDKYLWICNVYLQHDVF